MIKIGIIKEGKLPPDWRVPFSPRQCRNIEDRFIGVKILVESSNIRCYSDEEYIAEGIEVSNDISECDIIMGVKEVPLNKLYSNKTYFFFSHTIKEQPYNSKLLQTVLKRNIRLIDYETLTDVNGFRLLGFGKWAGIVGAYNGLYAWGEKHGSFRLKRAYLCKSREDVNEELKKVRLPSVKIILTGCGRVGKGAKETLDRINMRFVSVDDFVNKEFDEAVCCQVDADEYRKHKDGKPFDYGHFFANPQEYTSTFWRFAKVADIHIACHFWDPKAPVFYTKEDMRKSEFNIKLVADISCDINGPIASTIRACSIEKPIYGYNTDTGKEVDFRNKDAVTVMAVDNLPCELPRESSEDFGQTLIERVLPHIFNEDPDRIIERATIAKNGQLMPNYSYLQNYVETRD